VIWRLGCIGVAAVGVSFLAEPLRSALAGLEEARRVSITDVLTSGSPLLAIPFLAFGPVSLMFATLAATLLILFLRFNWARQNMRLRPVFDVTIWRQIAHGGTPFLVNNGILQVYGFLSLAILRQLTDVSAVGIYAQATKLFGTFQFVPTALGAALLPSLSRLAHASLDDFRRMEARVLNFILTLGLPVTTGVILLAEPLCRLLYTPGKFVELPLTLQVMALAIIPVYIVSVLYQFLVAQNRNSLWTWFLLGTVGVYALLSYLLIPFTRAALHNGPVGAAGALVGAETCSAVCALVLLRTNPFNVEMTGRVLRALFATACMAAVLWLTRGLFLLIPAALGTATFLLLAWWMKALPPETQAQFVELVRRKLRRAA
jgi:O-antigen/teichoic acid export membrane protein